MNMPRDQLPRSDDGPPEEVPWRDLAQGLVWESSLETDRNTPQVPRGIRVMHAGLTELDGYAAHTAREVSAIAARTLEIRDSVAFATAAINGMAPKVAVLDTDNHKVYEQLLLSMADIQILKAAAEAQANNLDLIAKSLGVTNTTPPPNFREKLDSLAEEVEATADGVLSVRQRQTKTDIQVKRVVRTNKELAKKLGITAIAITSLASAFYQLAKAFKEAPPVTENPAHVIP